MVAGGGTGGHLYPGVAVVEAWQRLEYGDKNECVFVGTERGIEARVIPSLDYRLHTLKVEGLKGRGISQKLRSLLKIPKSIVEAMRVLNDEQPDVVLGVGGYASGPLVLAAWLKGIPVALAEQNSVAGLTNRILAFFASSIFVAQRGQGSFFKSSKVLHVGNPVRRALLAAASGSRDSTPGASPENIDDTISVLILGGSQGAKVLNEMMPLVLKELEQKLETTPALNLQSASEHPSAPEESTPNQAIAQGRPAQYVVEWVHQCGRGRGQGVREAYASTHSKVDVREFIVDMKSAYAKADLVIARAGATTLAELCACGKPSVLVPFAAASDDHQTANAQVLVNAGAAIMISEAKLRDTSAREALVDELSDLVLDPLRRAKMRSSALSEAKPNADEDIAHKLKALLC